MDSIVGYDLLAGMNQGLVDFLQVSRRATLDKINHTKNSTIQEPKWLSVEELNVPF